MYCALCTTWGDTFKTNTCISRALIRVLKNFKLVKYNIKRGRGVAFWEHFLNYQLLNQTHNISIEIVTSTWEKEYGMEMKYKS